jgi:hypothetical protein
MRQAKRLIEEADKRLREGEVSDAFLGRMGMTNAEFRRFVTAWQRQLETAGANPQVTPGPDAMRTAAGAGGIEVLRYAGGSGVRPIISPPAGRPDGPQGLVQGSDVRVSPRLKPAVSAYFEAVSRMAPDGGGREPSR